MAKRESERSVTVEDLVEKASEVADQLSATAEQARFLILASAIALGIAYMIGRRRGRRAAARESGEG